MSSSFGQKNIPVTRIEDGKDGRVPISGEGGRGWEDGGKKRRRQPRQGQEEEKLSHFSSFNMYMRRGGECGPTSNNLLSCYDHAEIYHVGRGAETDNWRKKIGLFFLFPTLIAQ